MNSVHPSAIQECQQTFRNPQEHKMALCLLRIRPFLREKLENHVCWKVLEAVLQEQAEWVGLNAATQEGSPF